MSEEYLELLKKLISIPSPSTREAEIAQFISEWFTDRGFDVVAISLDRSEGALAKYLEENAIPWTNLMGKEARDAATKYGIRGIPSLVLVDREGIVVAVNNKVADLAPEIEKLLDNDQQAPQNDQ